MWISVDEKLPAVGEEVVVKYVTPRGMSISPARLRESGLWETKLDHILFATVEEWTSDTVILQTLQEMIESEETLVKIFEYDSQFNWNVRHRKKEYKELGFGIHKILCEWVCNKLKRWEE